MATTAARKPGTMSDERRRRLRLEISREAARLFWDQGVAATSGEQIADAVGLSVRTIWRHFRSKESCAEPIVAQGVEWFMAVLRGWPRESSLEEHLTAELERYGDADPPVSVADELLATKMIALSRTEPALRTAWLMACDQLVHEMTTILAERLGLAPDDLRVRLHAAAAGAVIRVLDEHIGDAVLADRAAEYRDLAATAALFCTAIRTATGGAVGDPVE